VSERDRKLDQPLIINRKPQTMPTLSVLSRGRQQCWLDHFSFNDFDGEDLAVEQEE
jgi:hypothetical protein